jgi:hypothetical protein
MRWLLLALAACGGSDTPTDAPCQPSILYLNRGGGTYAHSSFDSAALNASSIVDTTRTLGPYPHDDIDWRFTAQCIRDALAPFPISITESDPGMTPHVELVFTTAFWGGSAITFAIPDSCRAGHQIGFVFGDTLSSTNRACQVALIAFAQMTALLSYENNCNDIVDRSMDCAPERTFTDQDAPCVDANAQPIACRCGGMTQNTFRALSAAHRACP